MNMTLPCPTPPHPSHERSSNVPWRYHAPPHPTPPMNVYSSNVPWRYHAPPHPTPPMNVAATYHDATMPHPTPPLPWTYIAATYHDATMPHPTPPLPSHERSSNVTWRYHAPPHPTQPHRFSIGEPGAPRVYIYIYIHTRSTLPFHLGDNSPGLCNFFLHETKFRWSNVDLVDLTYLSSANCTVLQRCMQCRKCPHVFTFYVV